MRLNQYIAHSGLCSRRQADELIKEGRVTLNDKPIENLSIRVEEGDIVKIDGEPITNEKLIYILLNKPRNTITTTDDEQDRRTVIDIIEPRLSQTEFKNTRVYPVGRLDRNTIGLLLLTNDGKLTQELTHPKYEVEKIYQVELDKELSEEDFQSIKNGVELEDGFMKVDDIDFPDKDDKRIVGVKIHSGKNRIVRRLFEHFGYRVVLLDRVVYAGLTKWKLPRGEWRFLEKDEIELLKNKKVNPKTSFQKNKRR